MIDPPALDNSNTDPEAGFVEIAERFPPSAPKAPPSEVNLELPKSLEKL